MFHDKLLQKGVFCDPATPSAIFMNLTIQDDLTDPWNIAVVFPNSELLNLDTLPSLRNWRTMFVKIYAVYTSSRLPALYSPEECIQTKPYKIILLSAVILAGLMTVIGICSAKIVGLELFGVLQLAYFTLPSHGSLDIYLEPLTYLKISNGFNSHLQDESPFALPLSISNLKLDSEFLNNFNVMALVAFGFMSVVALLYLNARLKGN